MASGPANAGVAFETFIGTDGAGGNVRMKREGFEFTDEEIRGKERADRSVFSIIICLDDIVK